jgi:hypothetical protein
MDVLPASTNLAMEGRANGRPSGWLLSDICDALAVLGLFLGSLCRYCHEEHGMNHVIEDFFVYEFAKVRYSSTDVQTVPISSGGLLTPMQTPGAVADLAVRPGDLKLHRSRIFQVQALQRWYTCHAWCGTS